MKATTSNSLVLGSGSLVEDYVTIKGGGVVQLNDYGSGSNTGTATQRLGVDSSGNIIEIPIGGGAVDGSGTANTVTMWSDTDTITDAPITINGNNATFAGNVIIGTSTTTPSVHYDNLVIEDVAGNNVGISLISGTGNNTALYFGDSADTDVGQLKYSHSTNDMFFVVNASTAMTINSSGNVGINYTAAPYKLSVNENGTATTNIGVYSLVNGAGTNNYAFYADANSGTSTNFGVYSNSGKNAFLGDTGIGTDSPLGSSKLHVSSANGTAYTSSAQLRVSGGATNNNRATILFSDDALSDGKLSYYPASGTSAYFSLSARGTEADFIVKADGNVGIGTDSPATYYSGADNLVVYQASGEAGITVATATDTTGALYFADGTSGDEQYRGGIAYTHSTDKLSLVSGVQPKWLLIVLVMY